MTRDTSHTDDDRPQEDRGQDENRLHDDRGQDENRPHDDRGGDDAPAGDPYAPDEMRLDELREEIRGIDHDLVELIARRTYVADTIAQVKAETGLPTTDEEQERRVMDRAGANAETYDVDANLVKAIFRLLIELNKVEQRESR
jgi:chorismate mutase